MAHPLLARKRFEIKTLSIGSHRAFSRDFSRISIFPLWILQLQLFFSSFLDDQLKNRVARASYFSRSLDVSKG